MVQAEQFGWLQVLEPAGTFMPGNAMKTLSADLLAARVAVKSKVYVP